MKESIIIRNIGPLHEVEIDDIRPFTVFVGKSGSGKSTILKVLAMCRWIFKMTCIRFFLNMSGVDISIFTFDFNSYVAKNGLRDYLKPESSIVYQKGNCKISYSKAGLRVDKITDWDNISLEKISFISDKRNMIPEILQRNSDKNNLNYFLRESYEDYKKAVETVRTLNLDCLGVDFRVEKGQNGRDKFKIYGDMDGQEYSVNLSDSSSGTQTVTPLSVILEYFTRHYDVVDNLNKAVFQMLSSADRISQFKGRKDIGAISSRMVSFHIEEPELSLYPYSQCQLMDFIVDRCFHSSPLNCSYSVMIATHSPYIVNHLNLLGARAAKGVANLPSLSMDSIGVYEVVDGFLNDLNQGDLIDTRLLSDPIEDTYSQYNEILGL